MKNKTMKFEMTRKEKEVFGVWLFKVMENYWPSGWTDARKAWTKEEYETIKDVYHLLLDWYPEDQDHVCSKGSLFEFEAFR